MCSFFCYSVPQYVYPSAYMATPGVTIPVSPHSPLSPTAAAAAGQFFDYAASFPNSAATAGQFANGFEAAAYPYTTAAGYMPTAAAAYASYAVPQPVGHFAHFQTQQIQERMQ